MGTITLISSDGETFIVDKDIAFLSVTLRNMLECAMDDDSTEAIPVPVTGIVLSEIVKYCESNKDILKQEDESCGCVRAKRGEPGWCTCDKNITERRCTCDTAPPVEKEVFNNKLTILEKKMLFEMLIAVNYLDINSFVTLLCKEIARRIDNATDEEKMTFFIA
jgi:S-phase kinase-associated protein 1